MRIARTACWSATLTATAFVACGLPSSDEFAKGDRPAPSTGGLDGATTSDSGDAGPSSIAEGGTTDAGDAGGATNLFADGDFEDGTCAGANFFQGQGGASADEHAGHFGCQACRADESITFFTFNPFYIVHPPTVGATYHARAWVKVGANSFKDQQISIAIRTSTGNDNTGFTNVEQDPSNPTLLTDQWQLIETSLTVTKAATELDLFVSSQTLATAGDRCFVVDDVELTLASP